MIKNSFIFICCCLLAACQQTLSDKSAWEKVRLITLDPGHFHAALVLKYPNDRLDSTVYVYAPEGKELDGYLDFVRGFNNRETEATHWREIVYTGPDFLETMESERAGNAVVLAGNNRNKINYIASSVQAGHHVLSDKPLIIEPAFFPVLEDVYAQAQHNGQVLYDLMTERYDILHILQKELMHDTVVFGHLLTGDPQHPAITVNSGHSFYKEVDGRPLIRPAWFYDIRQQGEGIADITTHAIDLINWKCFADLPLAIHGDVATEPLDYRRDIKVYEATRYPTLLTREEFSRSTGEPDFPDYLQTYLHHERLHVFSNGSIGYSIRDVHVRLDVAWQYMNPPGAGDLSRTVIRGSGADLYIIQDKEQEYKPKLYVRCADGREVTEFRTALERKIISLHGLYPELSLADFKDLNNTVMIEIVVPERYKKGHEAHFAQVLDRFLDYIEGEPLPDWEIPNTLAKYYITTEALLLAREENR